MNSTDKNIILQETKCLTASELLRYRDNKMSADERHRTERHLVDCAFCSEALEGAAFVSSPLIFDKVLEDVGGLTSGGSQPAVPARKYWLAAASVAALAVMAAYVYTEYNKVQHPNVALQKEPVALPASENTDALVSAEPAQLQEQQVEKAKVISSRPAIKTPVENSVQVQDTPEESIAETESAPAANDIVSDVASEKTAADEVAEEIPQTLSYPVQATNQASYPRLITSDNKKATRSKSSSSGSKPAAGSENTSASKDASGNTVTYVHNLKVIDYSVDNLEQDKSFTVTGNNTEPKFENKDKKEQTAEAPDAVTRKVTYLELIAAPVADYKNGKYADAISGFNEILAIHPSDQNAMFYKGMSFYRLERFQEAIASLSGPANEIGGTFSDEAKFYMARSYAATGNEAIAKDLFRQIAEGGGFYSERAREELKKLQ